MEYGGEGDANRNAFNRAKAQAVKNDLIKKTCQAKKKPPRGALTEAEKRTNQKLAQIRVQVEHDRAGVKRSRIVKDVLCNTKSGVSDAVMEAACGLHNVRGENRKRRPKT